MGATQERRTVGAVLVIAWLLSIVHSIDNTLRYDDYTGGQESFVTRPMIPLSWVLFTLAGFAGWRALQHGRRTRAGWLLAVFSLSGLVGAAHFTTVSPSDFSPFQNTFIVLDFLAGAAVFAVAGLLATGRTVGRPAVSGERSSAPSSAASSSRH